ncbi:3-hydroxyacyl-CoA dehydrogenase family protein [Micromonospora sp. NPDC049275]|uniref:3-hydroxyacyl-CoA dehydrogenase family protein n=1 Tax=Micromonospora sp. NPDC049275 TaxID=3364268 RepID=UPI0037236C79
METKQVKQVGVVGAGTMGIGVSHAFAERGIPVLLMDISEEILDRAQREIKRNHFTYRMFGQAKGQPQADPDELMSRIDLTVDLERFANVDYVVENATEDWAVKEPIYRQLDRICPPHTVFGVNTSAISVTRLGGVTSRPAQVIGTHFMNPVPLKPVVEVIRGYHTSTETIERTRELFTAIGKDSIVVEDSPGFVTNRVMMLTVNEAAFLLYEDVASAKDIDRLFVDCFGHKMGPLETCDLIGLDTVLLSLEVLYDSFNDPKYRPCPLLKKLVHAGRLGRKSGQGFHSYV